MMRSSTNSPVANSRRQGGIVMPLKFPMMRPAPKWDLFRLCCYGLAVATCISITFSFHAKRGSDEDADYQFIDPARITTNALSLDEQASSTSTPTPTTEMEKLFLKTMEAQSGSAVNITVVKAILNGEYFLSNIYIPDGELEIIRNSTVHYDKVRGSFCPVDWTVQKQSPNSMPRYRDVLKGSDCSTRRIDINLAKIVELCRLYDEQPNSQVHSLKEAGFIFHESRCGSTLVANMLTVAYPEAHRIYSEPLPLQRAIGAENRQLVDDVLYIMGRSNDAKEERVYYKLQSTSVRFIQGLPEKLPWIFMYRDPKEVIASHFNPTETDNVVCLRDRRRDRIPWRDLLEEIANGAGRKLDEISDAEFCSVRLASLSLSAIKHYQKTGQGRFLNYNTLPNSLWETILPDHFGVKPDAESIERMKTIAGVYSKSGSDGVKSWKDDSEKKHSLVTKKQRKATSRYNTPNYEQMEKFASMAAKS